VLRLNLLLLMLVAFLPFPTKLIAEAIDETVAAERAAIVFDGLVMLSISTVIGVLWRYLARHRDLLEPDVADQEVAAIPSSPRRASVSMSSSSRSRCWRRGSPHSVTSRSQWSSCSASRATGLRVSPRLGDSAATNPAVRA
jgi:hypothetical protein